MKKRIKVFIVFALIIAILSSLAYIFFRYIPEQRRIAEHMQMIQDYYDEKVARFEEENKRIIPGETDVVFLGDSLTDGCDL